MKTQSKPKVAHFLFHAVLSGSPPNTALKQIFTELGYQVDEYAPDAIEGDGINSTSYGLIWALKQAWRPHWKRYEAFSCTSEDPIAVAGLLAFIWRKPLIFISDEIKSGSYRGDRPNYYKRLCRWLMRRSAVTVVNDASRIPLQKEYAQLPAKHTIIVYPGCFVTPPPPADKTAMRKAWGVKPDHHILCFSGGCNLTAGIDLTIDALDAFNDLHVVTQPLAVDELTRFLMVRTHNSSRIYMQEERLSWNEAWASAAVADIGVAIYRNQAPQFQNMGISSNRLCMFLAMGVPVIVNKQPSFDFLDQYQCGVQVETQDEFNQAIKTILADLEQYKANALRCTAEYIDTAGKLQVLKQAVAEALS